MVTCPHPVPGTDDRKAAPLDCNDSSGCVPRPLSVLGLSGAMPGEVLQRGAPRGHHSQLPNSPTPAPRPTRSRLYVPPTTPWQVLYANPSTYKHHPGGFRYLFLALRSELPRDAGGGGVAGDQAARAARNEDCRAVHRGPVGPCRSVFHHKFACFGTVMCSLCPLGMSPERSCGRGA